MLAERQALGDLIAEILPIAAGSQDPAEIRKTLAKAAADRLARQARLRRAMLHQRHVEACGRLSVKPVSEEVWKDLWPN